jgi:outer membrane protein
MKKSLVMIVASVFMVTGFAYAQESLKIGYVDMRKAVSECKAGKAATAELDKTIKEKQVKIDAEKKKLEAMQADYEKKASDMKDKEKLALQKEFQEKVQVYQKMLAEAQKEVKDKEAAYTKKILDDVNTVINGIAKGGKYTLILGRTENLVLYAKDGLDLTAKVIQKMDAQ